MLLLAPLLAHAASPSPDRPSVSRTAVLVAPGTLETELGAVFGPARSAPLLVKWAVDERFEPRLGMDLAGVSGGGPAGLEAGLKVGLAQPGTWALTLHGASAVPTTAGEPYDASIDFLATGGLGDRATLQVNGGLLVEGTGGGLALGGLPLAVAPGLVAGRFAFFGELALIAAPPSGQAADRVILDAGLSVRLTEIVLLDAAGGWLLGDNVPFAQVGLSTNLGSPR